MVIVYEPRAFVNSEYITVMATNAFASESKKTTSARYGVDVSMLFVYHNIGSIDSKMKRERFADIYRDNERG
jgi:hypothetical protein